MGIILERTTPAGVPVPFGEDRQPLEWSTRLPGLLTAKKRLRADGAGINARAIDFAKFGQMFLNNGAWEGQRILPAAWVKESTSPDPNDTRPWDLDEEGWKEAGGYYKYFWWGIPNADGSYDYVARGHLGQRIASRLATTPS
jgi:CubicO group peptidase (beta-lactamase class C family)